MKALLWASALILGVTLGMVIVGAPPRIQQAIQRLQPVPSTVTVTASPTPTYSWETTSSVPAAPKSGIQCPSWSTKPADTCTLQDWGVSPTPTPRAFDPCSEGCEGYLRALRNNGFGVTNSEDAIRTGIGICIDLRTMALDDVVEVIYSGSPEGTFMDRDGARLLVTITRDMLCPTGTVTSPTPSAPPTSRGKVL